MRVWVVEERTITGGWRIRHNRVLGVGTWFKRRKLAEGWSQLVRGGRIRPYRLVPVKGKKG